MNTTTEQQFIDTLSLFQARTSRIAVQGALIALIAVIATTALVAYAQSNAISLLSLSSAQYNNKALWLLDFLPFVFAFWGQRISTLAAKDTRTAIINQTHTLWNQNQIMHTRLKEQMESDDITGLSNRNNFQVKLSEHIESIEPESEFAIVSLGIDTMSEVHQATGFDKAEILLRHVSEKLGKIIPDTGILARTSFDEFSLLIPHTSKPEGVTAIARTIRDNLADPFVLDNMTIKIEVSIGACLFPKDGSDSGTLMRHAEAAMYVDRNENNDITFYSPDFGQNKVMELTLKSEIAEAISEGHLVLHYQPKMERDFQVHEAEALVRWHHPEKGLIPPNQFIPFVERNGLNRELLHWVLGDVATQIASWQRQGIHIGVCINLSMLDLMDNNLPSVLDDVLRRSGVAPSRIKLELTETMVMANHHRALEVMSAIADLGIRTAIDNFGTGYASLSYLQKLPSRELKVDRSFIMDMVDNEHHSIIVKTIIDLAHNLSMNVVAEGVENEETLRKLLGFGCDAMQGFHIGRPMEASRFISWLHDWNERRQNTSLAA